MSIMAKIIVITALLSFVVIIVCQDEFVVQKNQKGSIASLKTTCNDDLMAGIKISPYHLQKIARIQDISISMVEQMLEDLFWVRATKQELTDDVVAYKKFYKRQEEIERLLQEQLDFLQAQQKKYSKNNNVVIATVVP